MKYLPPFLKLFAEHLASRSSILLLFVSTPLLDSLGGERGLASFSKRRERGSALSVICTQGDPTLSSLHIMRDKNTTERLGGYSHTYTYQIYMYARDVPRIL